MIADLKPYESYENTDQKWLGEIPGHWQCLPHRAMFTEVKERGFGDEQMLSVTIKRGIIRQADLLKDSSKKDSSNTDKSKYKLVCPEDLAYNKMRAWQGAVGVSGFRGIISPAYVVMRPRQKCVPRYFHYLYRTPHFAKEAERWSYGITSDMWSLRPEDFKLIYSVSPPQDEQELIVRFLDWVSVRLEKAIQAKRRVIALLEEQKQAIIHRAVTRGLDDTVPPKPSALDWLGEVPEHWEVGSVRSRVKIQRGRFLHRPRNDPQFYGGKYPFIQTGDIARGGREITGYSQTLNERGLRISRMFPAGTLAMVITGAKTGCVSILGFDACFPDSAVGLIPRDENTDTGFLFFAFQALKREMDRTAITSTQENLNVGRIGALETVWPSPNEQFEIVDHLNTELERIDRSIKVRAREIKLIREYRTRLISDVVTGKLNVRDVARSLPTETESIDMEAPDADFDEFADDELETELAEEVV